MFFHVSFGPMAVRAYLVEGIASRVARGIWPYDRPATCRNASASDKVPMPALGTGKRWASQEESCEFIVAGGAGVSFAHTKTWRVRIDRRPDGDDER